MISEYYGITEEQVNEAVEGWKKWKRVYTWHKKERLKQADIEDFYKDMPMEYVASIEAQAILDKDEYLNRLGDVKGLNILDFGCGTGVYGTELISRGANVDFYDLETPALKYLTWKLNKKELKGNIVIDIKELKEEYDIIICIDVLEHMTKPFNLIKMLYSKLKKGGKLILATPLIETILHSPPRYKMEDIIDEEHIEGAVKDWIRHKGNDYVSKKFIVKGNLMVKPYYNCLMLYDYHPHTTGRFLEAGLREYCKVINSNQAKININGEGIGKICKAMNIDFILQVDSGRHYRIPKGIKCLKVNYSIDTFIKTELKLEKLKNYDLKLFAQSRFVLDDKSKFLPLAVDTSIYRRVNTDKKYEIGFCGTMLIDDLHHERNTILKQLAPDFNMYIGKDSNEHANLKYNQSYFVFNCGVSKDLNMRIFEAMATGGILCMNEVDNMDDYFEVGKHYIKYKDADDLKKQIIGFFSDPEGHIKMCDIVNNANKEVVEKHTYKHRAWQIVEWIKEILK